MDRIGLKTLLVIALLLGGVFEFAKRSSWPLTSDTNKAVDPTELTPSRPYARRMLEAIMPTKRSKRPAPTPAPVFTAAKLKPALYIPPTQGQFDSSAGKKVADPKQKPQTQDKKTAADKWKAWDKHRRYDPTRQCLRKRTAEEDQELAALEAQEPKVKTANVKSDDEDKIGECKDDEKVADKEDEQDELDDLAEQPDSELATPNSTTVSGGILSNRNEGNQLNGLEEWKALLLNQPNFKETVRLIELAQAGKISNALFYKLVELMITDPRPGIQEMGILAAGRTPSYESFHMLIRVVKAENLGSKLRDRAEKELNAYEQPRFLSTLERILKDSSDVFAVVWATRQLEDSAHTYLTAKFVRPETPAGPLAGKNPYVSTFQRFVVVLQDLTKVGNNSEEMSQARSTLSKIQDLLRSFS